MKHLVLNHGNVESMPSFSTRYLSVEMFPHQMSFKKSAYWSIPVFPGADYLNQEWCSFGTVVGKRWCSAQKLYSFSFLPRCMLFPRSASRRTHTENIVFTCIICCLSVFIYSLMDGYNSDVKHFLLA